MINNIMTVDLEDYFCDLPFSSWTQYDGRVVQTTKNLLLLFEKYNVGATFFTLGWIAEKHPDLIEEIKRRGHEISSHGYSHLNILNMRKEDFEIDLAKSLGILSKVSGDKVLGFRAPFFSINRKNLWAFDIIRRYLKYDSSIFPMRPHYGLPSAPRHIYRISNDNPLKEDSDGNFIEIPMTTLRLPFLGNFPVAGGIYMRFLPYSIIRHGIKKFNEAGLSAVFYIHPKDLDPGFPRIGSLAWHNYWGLEGATQKFESLLRTFRFVSICEHLRL